MDSQKNILLSLEKNPIGKHPALVPEGQSVGFEKRAVRFSPECCVVNSRIGLGTHAEVYEATLTLGNNLKNSVSIALKVEKPLMIAEGCLSREKEALKALSGLEVTPMFVGAFSVIVADKTCLAVGMELFDECLSSLRISEPRCSADRVSMLDWLLVRMFKCLFDLHDAGFIHRDIKLSNFMYKLDDKGDLRVALVDLGSSIRVGQEFEDRFRGTSAYSNPLADPMQSQPVDDYWSVIFSILELWIRGGLPWRAVTDRGPEARARVNVMKVELLKTIADDANSSVSGLCRCICRLLMDFHSDIYRLRGEITSLCERSGTFRTTPNIVDQLRPENACRVQVPTDLKRVSLSNFLMNNQYRHRISELRSRTIPFPVPDGLLHPPAFQSGIQAILASLAYDYRDKILTDEKPLCIFEVRGQACDILDCPLEHVPGSGFARSATLRSLRRSLVCVDKLLFHKCRDTACNRSHVSVPEVRAIFQSHIFTK
jgi:serine/threonine protein kinase